MSALEAYDVKPEVAKGGFINDDQYQQMYKRSIEDPEGFWSDMADEFDAEEELSDRRDDGEIVCNAKVRLDDLNDDLGLSLPEDGSESLGGLLYRMIGRVPRVGDKRRVGNVEFEILSVERQRIDRVRITGPTRTARNEEGGGGPGQGRPTARGHRIDSGARY